MINTLNTWSHNYRWKSLNYSLPFNRRWSPFRERRKRSVTAASPSFARAVIKRWTNFVGAVVSVLRAGTELLERWRALKQRSIAVMNFGLALVWNAALSTLASPLSQHSLPSSQRYSNAGASGTPLKQRPCFRYIPVLCAVISSVVEIR